MIRSDTMHSEHHQQNRNDANKVNQDDNSDGTWLLITSTMGLTLGYVRIDDHDHALSLSEIRAMIDDKLKDNTEYCHGFNFGTGWPLRIVNKNEEHAVLAINVLPSVSVLSAQSAQHIVNTNNPISAATAIQYGMTPTNILNMNFMTPTNMQPLPLSALFTPLHQLANSINKLPTSEQYYSPNTVALLQPQPQSHHTFTDVHTSNTNQNIKTEQEHVQMEQSAHEVSLLSANSNHSNPQIPSLPPFSPPTLSKHELDQKARIQKQKLQNLLPLSKEQQKTEKAKTPKKSDSKSKTTSNKSTPKHKSKPKLPRLKPIGADGNVIETTETNGNNNNNKTSVAKPGAQAQKDLFCPECEKKFDTERGYRLHMNKQHQIKLARGRNKERRFKCEHNGCSRSFYQSSDLRRHQRVHLGVKPFKCSLCKKEFTQRGSLYRHIKTSHKGRDPKTLIILQTEQTLPSGQKTAVQTKDKETDQVQSLNLPPPLINDNDNDTTNNLPPEIKVSTSDVGLPPPLSAIVKDDDDDERMTQIKPN